MNYNVISLETLLYLLSRVNTEEASHLFKSLIKSPSSLEKVRAIKYLASIKGLDASNFYEHLRDSYNSGRSKLYLNLMKEDSPLEERLISLSSYILQANIYLNRAINKREFIKQLNLVEAASVLNRYYTTLDIEPVLKEISAIKANIKMWESFYREEKKDE